jgi:hypothetical protein
MTFDTFVSILAFLVGVIGGLPDRLIDANFFWSVLEEVRFFTETSGLYQSSPNIKNYSL